VKQIIKILSAIDLNAKEEQTVKRIVFLVDMNAFFISCEMTRNPSLQGRPAAVAGDPQKRSGIILAANYEARKYGVKTTMTINEARRLCPGLLFVPPDHKFYSDRSKEVMQLLDSYTPVVEQNSIDEAWLDMTGCEALYSSAGSVAQKIMKEIEDNLGLWCSIGIAENKFLAKMASEMKKPLGITELWHDSIKTKLWPLPVEAMYGIGTQTAAKLRNIGISTIGDIARYDREALEKKFGKYGNMIYELANGIDNSPVTPHKKDEMKSIGRSTTLPEDITDIVCAKKILMLLAEEVGTDAREHSKRCSTVQITIKYGDFQSITRQKTIPSTFLTSEILKASVELLQNNWNTLHPVRLLGIGITGFELEPNGQLSLFDQAAVCKPKKEENLEKAVDMIRARFGKETIKRATLIKKDIDEI
jgi:DNA polymerase-4